MGLRPMSHDSVLRYLANSPSFEKASRLLIALEMLCIMAPMSLLLLILCSALLGAGSSFKLADLALLMQLGFAALPFACGWRLAVSLLFRGRVGMANLAAPIWWLAMLGALLTLAGCAAAVLPRSMFEALNQLANVLRPFTFGAPLLLPFAHLMFERTLAAFVPSEASPQAATAAS